MKQLGSILIVILLLLAIVAVAPAAWDTIATVSDRQPLTLNLQQQQQLQQQLQPQIIFIQPDQTGPASDPADQPPAATVTPASDPGAAIDQPPAPTATTNPAQLTAERAAACQAARDAGRRMPPYCAATPAPAAGYGR